MAAGKEFHPPPGATKKKSLVDDILDGEKVPPPQWQQTIYERIAVACLVAAAACIVHGLLNFGESAPLPTVP